MTRIGNSNVKKLYLQNHVNLFTFRNILNILLLPKHYKTIALSYQLKFRTFIILPCALISKKNKKKQDDLTLYTHLL